MEASLCLPFALCLKMFAMRHVCHCVAIYYCICIDRAPGFACYLGVEKSKGLVKGIVGVSYTLARHAQISGRRGVYILISSSSGPTRHCVSITYLVVCGDGVRDESGCR